MASNTPQERLLYFKSDNLNCHCEKPTGSRWASLPRGGRHRRWIKQIIVQCHWAGQAVVFASHVSQSLRRRTVVERLMRAVWKEHAAAKERTTGAARILLLAPTEWHHHHMAPSAQCRTYRLRAQLSRAHTSSQKLHQHEQNGSKTSERVYR